MSNGWQCPKCGYVWAPYYPSCDNCNRPEHEKVVTTTTIAFERAKVLEEALEAIANQDYRGNMPPGMREACEALRVYREGK